MMLLWPWQKAKVAGRGKHTDATVGKKHHARSLGNSPTELNRRKPRLGRCPFSLFSHGILSAGSCEWPAAEWSRTTGVGGLRPRRLQSLVATFPALVSHNLVEHQPGPDTRNPWTGGVDRIRIFIGFIRSPSIHVIDESTATLPLFPDTPQGPFEIARLFMFMELEELVRRGTFLEQSAPCVPRNAENTSGCRSSMRSCRIAVVAAIARVLPRASGSARVISIEEALTLDKHYPDLQEAARDSQSGEILVNSADLCGGTVHPYLVEIDRLPRHYTFSKCFDDGDPKTLKNDLRPSGRDAYRFRRST